MYQIQCLDRNGDVVAQAAEVNDALVVKGSMRAWRETAAELLPLLREAAATVDPQPDKLTFSHGY